MRSIKRKYTKTNVAFKVGTRGKELHNNGCILDIRPRYNHNIETRVRKSSKIQKPILTFSCAKNAIEKIYHRTTGSSGRGIASVARVIWAIIYFGRKQKINNKDVLLDYNINKLTPSEVLFEKKLFFYQINNHFFSLNNRFELVKALLAYLLNGDKKQLSIKYAELLALDIGKNLPKYINIYFWNPYTIKHYMLLALLPNQSFAYIHTPYYMVFQAKHIWANKFISELYKWNGDIKIVTPPHIKLKGCNGMVRFYWTKIPPITDNEKRLKQFVKFLNKKNIKIEIFLHYLDRNEQLITENKNPYTVYNLNNSLDCLYEKQLSFSGSSSIGYELLSLDINHYIFTRDHVIFDEIHKVYNNDSSIINIKQAFSEIFDKIVRPWLRSI